jgi:hypothetical protein
MSGKLTLKSSLASSSGGSAAALQAAVSTVQTSVSTVQTSVNVSNAYLFNITQVRSGTSDGFATINSTSTFGGIATVPFTLSGAVFTMTRDSNVVLVMPWSISKTTAVNAGAATIAMRVNGVQVGQGGVASAAPQGTVATGTVTVPITLYNTASTIAVTMTVANAAGGIGTLTLQCSAPIL